VVAVDLKHQAELGRLLAGAGGYVVRTAEGKQLGHVDHVRYREHADRPDLIAVRRHVAADGHGYVAGGPEANRG